MGENYRCIVVQTSTSIMQHNNPIVLFHMQASDIERATLDLSQVQHQIVVQRNAATRFGLAHEQLIGGVVLTSRLHNFLLANVLWRRTDDTSFCRIFNGQLTLTTDREVIHLAIYLKLSFVSINILHCQKT